MRKIIVIGCGDYGKKAAYCFGDTIAFFADNDIAKQGKTFFGKRIESVERAVEYADCLFVIAVCNYKEIALQLSNMGVENYTWYIDDCDWCYLSVMNKIKARMRRIAVLGINNNTDAIYRFIKYGVPNENVCIAEKETRTKKFNGDWMIFDLESTKEWDAIVVTPGHSQTEYNYYCERLGLKDVVVNPVWKRRWFENGYYIKDLYSEELAQLAEDDYIERYRSVFDAEDVVNNCVVEMEKTNPLFHKVEIETINRCNLNCSFCPVGASRDPREFARMSDDMFYSIINQLADLNYDGRLSLYSNNEPLLDKRIQQFQIYARQKLPNAFIYLVTNGTLLSVSMFKAIIPYLDELVIDNYDANKQLIKPISEIRDYCINHKELWDRVKIVIRNPNEYLTSRGGDSPNRTRDELFPNVKCTLPWFQLIIRPTGEISTCCADALGTRTMGDLRKQTLLEAWNSPDFKEFRASLNRGRGSVDKCKYCDAFNLF